MDEPVTTRREGDVLEVILSRPARRNALDVAAARSLARAVDDVSPTVRAILLRAEGPAFCAGGDIVAMQAGFDDPEDQHAPRALAEAVHAAVLAVATSPVPTVAALHGQVVGGGVGLAAACDVRVAARSLRLRLAFSSVGLSADSGTTWFLPRLIGHARAADWLLCDRLVDEQGALEAGFVTRVVEDDALVAEAQDLAARLAMGPTQALGRTRRQLLAAFDLTLEDHLALEREDAIASFSTSDLREGLAAFRQRRPARFTGA